MMIELVMTTIFAYTCGLVSSLFDRIWVYSDSLPVRLVGESDDNERPNSVRN